VQQIQKKTDIMEKDIQTIIEKDMETYLGIRFIATEYSTGKAHGGRIDTLGIDENGSPVIIEYKRSVDSGAAMQGLFYLAWLMDHKSEFKLAVMKKYDEETSQNIDWSQPRVICIANDFKKYVIGAVGYMGPHIELMQYQLFNNNILTITDVYIENQNRNTNKINSIQTCINNRNDTIKNVFEDLKIFLFSLDDTVSMKEGKAYIAFRTHRNFALVYFHDKRGFIKVTVHINPDSIELEDGFTRDMRFCVNNGGDLDITIHNHDDLEKAKSLLINGYNNI